MAKAPRFDDSVIRNFAAEAGKAVLIPDPQLSRHYVRISPRGVKSFAVVSRNPLGKQVWSTLGRCDKITVVEARRHALDAIQRIEAGQAAKEPPQAPQGSYEQIARHWWKREVDGKGVISAKTDLRLLERHVFPTWGNRPFDAIKRSDVRFMLDQVEDASGARTADVVLGICRRVANWYAAGADDYVSPFTRGQRRQRPSETRRARTLSDDELRKLWTACDRCSAYGQILKLCLLTAQRIAKVANLKWADLKDGVWTIAQESNREKGTAERVALPKAAREIIDATPALGDNPYVFAGRKDDRHFSGFSKAKIHLDTLLGAGFAHWTPHDLRRTARSLMARAGVKEEIAERVLGHTQEAMIETYDRHDYFSEKNEALEKLSALLATIVSAGEDSRA